LWGISVSFGCVNSLISMPCAMSYVKYLRVMCPWLRHGSLIKFHNAII
jgi:hypothetical protein